MESRYINSVTAASLLGITERTVRRQIESGKLSGSKATGSQGGASGTVLAIKLEDVLERATLEQRMLWHESQSAIAATVTAADLATYKAAFGEEGLQKLAERQQAVITLDGILNGGDRGRGALIEALAGQLGVSSRTLRRWHTAYKDGGLAAIMEKTERKDKGKTRSMCQLAQDWVEARMCDNRKFPQTLILDRLREKERELADGACDVCPYCEWSAAREALKPEELAEYPMCQQATGRLIIPANRHAINRFVETLDKAQLTYARRGKRAWEAAFMQKTTRAKPTLINECWFGDHHKDFETAELEEKYSDGLGNFKHMGLVSRDGKHVLHAKGEKYGFVCEELDSSWQYVAALNFVDYSEGVQQEIEAVTVLYQATISTNEDPLRVREWPATGEILGHVDKGRIVDVLQDNSDGWPFIRFNELEGYVSGQYLKPVSKTEVKEETVEEVEVEVPEAQKVTIIDSEGNHFEPVGDFRVLIGSID